MMITVILVSCRKRVRIFYFYFLKLWRWVWQLTYESNVHGAGCFDGDTCWDSIVVQKQRYQPTYSFIPHHHFSCQFCSIKSNNSPHFPLYISYVRQEGRGDTTHYFAVWEEQVLRPNCTKKLTLFYWSNIIF